MVTSCSSFLNSHPPTLNDFFKLSGFNLLHNGQTRHEHFEYSVRGVV